MNIKRLGVGLILSSLLCAFGNAQGQNVTLKAQLNLAALGAGSGNDCWGYTSPSGREYAIMGLNNRTYFVDITNPSLPVAFQYISHGAGQWSCVKTYQNYCYVVSETSGVGIQVIDMSNIDNHQVTLVRTVANPGRTHTIAIDEYSGYLYTCGSNEGDATSMYFSLANPSNPVKVGQRTTNYVHEAQVVTYTSGPYSGRQIMFANSTSNGIDIIDVTNKAAPVLLSRTPYLNVAYTHQGWLDSTRQFMYMDDELDENQFGVLSLTRLFDVSNLSSPQLVHTFTTGEPTIDHNQYTKGNYLFQANYQSGLQIFNIANRTAPVRVGYYDTYQGGQAAAFNGAWSCYPYFNSNNVIISDIEGGLFVVDPTPAMNITAMSLNGNLPTRLDPDGGNAVSVKVAPSQNGLGSVKMKYRTGAVWQTITLTAGANSTYNGVFPATTCGARVEFYFEALDNLGAASTLPLEGPAKPFVAVSQDSENILVSDSFDGNSGWVVTNTAVADGAWARGVPGGNGGRSDPATAFGGSGQCFVTGIGLNADLDGGPTILTSPNLNCSGPNDKYIRFRYWFQMNNVGDQLRLEISNNGGNSWTLAKDLPTVAGWAEYSFRVADILAPTATVRVRLVASDNPNNTLYEAGLDQFELFEVVCVRPPISGTVTLQDLSISPNGQPVKVQIIQNGGIVDEQMVSLNASGGFNTTTTARGPVEILVRGDHWLGKKSAPLTLTDTGVSGLTWSLKNGDVVPDNVIDLSDYTAVALAFNAMETSPNWDRSADLNADGIVDLTDYTIIATNFNAIGE